MRAACPPALNTPRREDLHARLLALFTDAAVAVGSADARGACALGALLPALAAAGAGLMQARRNAEILVFNTVVADCTHRHCGPEMVTGIASEALTRIWQLKLLMLS